MPTKKIFLLLVFALFFIYIFIINKKIIPCDQAKNDCPQGMACSTEKGETYRCIKIPNEPPFALQFPMDLDTYVKCQQGNAVKNRSHNHDNILFSLDLYGLKEMPATKIYAVEDGVAYIYNQCSFRGNNWNDRNDKNCGEGYGNHIRILHEKNYISMYAHLSEIFIKDKQTVKRGEPIGLEGVSGRAGDRHLHFGMHHTEYPLEVLINPGWAGKSVPFKFKIIYSDFPDKIIDEHSLDFRCNLGLESAPFIKGVRLL